MARKKTAPRGHVHRAKNRNGIANLAKVAALLLVIGLAVTSEPIVRKFIHLSDLKRPAPTQHSPKSTSTKQDENYLEETYSCQGKQHCSQMNSCEQAMYYLANCPNTKMDGDNDGIPCERQWCF